MFEQCNCMVVKVTRDCNLRCKYCYIENKDAFKNEVMSFEVFKTLVDRICLDKEKTSDDFKRFSFIFHGGEPTIIGYENLNKFCHYAFCKFTEAGLDFNFGIQTNATLLDDKFLALFAKYNVDVGLSFDGGAKDSNKGRTNKGQDFFLGILDKCRQYGLQFGILSVVSPQNINYTKENIAFLQKKARLNTAKINFAEDVTHNGQFEVSPQEFFEKSFLVILNQYNKLLKNKRIFEDDNVNQLIDKYIKQLFDDSLGTFNSNYYGNCNCSFCGAGSRVLEISPDGSVNYCGRYSKDDEVSQCGDIKNLDFLAVHTRRKYYQRIYLKHKLLLDTKCDTCVAAGICDYGCLAFYYSQNKTFGIKTSFICEYYKAIIDYFSKHTSEIFKLYYLMNKKPDNTLYIRSSQVVTRDRCHHLETKINSPNPRNQKNRFFVIPDPDWKGPSNKCHQFKIIQGKK